MAVRLLAATNDQLEEAIARGAFREDLSYWLDVFRIELPPLRARQAMCACAREFIAHCTALYHKAVMERAWITTALAATGGNKRGRPRRSGWALADVRSITNSSAMAYGKPQTPPVRSCLRRSQHAAFHSSQRALKPRHMR